MEISSRFSDCFPLWHEAFGDSRSTVETFLSTVDHTPFFAVENGALLSMLFAVPQTVGKHRAAYLYAVATAKCARGRGLASALLRHAEDALKQDGFAACLLSPAEPGLAAWYLRQGYESWGPSRPLLSQTITGTPVSPEEYRALREKWLQNVPHNTPPQTVLSLYALTDRGAWDKDRMVERLGSPPETTGLFSPAPVLYKAFVPDFPKSGYFSFVMD